MSPPPPVNMIWYSTDHFDKTQITDSGVKQATLLGAQYVILTL